MADSFTMRAEIDPDDLKAIKHMENPEVILYPLLSLAMWDSLQDVEYAAVEWMDDHFENSTGALSGNFVQNVTDYRHGELTNDMPYAQRTNYGFNNQTDSLGRYYQFWAGIAWAQNAIVNAKDEVEINYQIAIAKALGRIPV